jgi:hypothetical protein
VEKLKELFELCDASVHINYNENRDLYLTVEQFLNDQERFHAADLGIDPDVRKVMADTNQMITIQAYPNTPIGFYVIYHWDLEAALDEMLSVLKDERIQGK